MKTENAPTLDLSSLPEQARQEVTDFFQFIQKKYRRRAATGSKTLKKTAQVLTDAGFVGMWKDRADMNDAASWVRQQRESVWSRHE